MHLFYHPLLKKNNFQLENEEHHHCTRVLRHQVNDLINITDGEGTIWTAQIDSITKKHTEFSIIEKSQSFTKPGRITIAIAPTKQLERMEWLVEKSGELLVDEIIFVRTKNSERTKINLDRLQKKAISALKQSRSGYKTKLSELIGFKQFIEAPGYQNKMIFNLTEEAQSLNDFNLKDEESIFLIGPEGDFTSEEVTAAKENGWISISMGKNILRTETAGIHIASIYRYINPF